jgi:hypothetical protein
MQRSLPLAVLHQIRPFAGTLVALRLGYEILRVALENVVSVSYSSESSLVCAVIESEQGRERPFTVAYSSKRIVASCLPYVRHRIAL